MTTLYRFTVTVDGNLTEHDHERLDQQLARLGGLNVILRETAELTIAETTYSAQDPFEITVKVD